MANVKNVILFKSLKHEFDPLDREIVERAFDAAWVAIKGNDRSIIAFDNDESLEAGLRRELIQIARVDGPLSNAEDLRDILLDRLSPYRPKA
jgi:hypothetical protein